MTPQRRLLWGLAGLAYLGYVGMAVMDARGLPVVVGLAVLPALRLLPDRMLIGVGIGVGWFLGGLYPSLSPYIAAALMVVSATLALAADRGQGWGWIVGVVAGYGVGVWWVSR